VQELPKYDERRAAIMAHHQEYPRRKLSVILISFRIIRNAALKMESISTSKIRTNAITKTPLVSLIIMINICVQFREKDTY